MYLLWRVGREVRSTYCTCGMPKYRSHTTWSNAMQGQQRNLIDLRPISCKQHSIHHLVPTTTSLLHNHRGIHGNGSQNETHRTNNSTSTRRNPNQGHPPRFNQRMHTTPKLNARQQSLPPHIHTFCSQGQGQVSQVVLSLGT